MKYAFRFERRTTIVSRAFIIIDAPNAAMAQRRVDEGVSEYLRFAELPAEHGPTMAPRLVGSDPEQIKGLSPYGITTIPHTLPEKIGT